jgi:ATP-dependent helicase/nuclease subunit B
LLIPYFKRYPTEIILAGFDEYYPQLQTLIDNLKKFGWTINYYEPNKYENSLGKKIAFSAQDLEITTAARWAKKLIAKNPKTTIGIVFADLTDLQLHYEITNIFTAVFGHMKNINITAGFIFSFQPIINSALNLLKIFSLFNLKNLNKFLLSPYIKAAEIEKTARIIIDFQLHQANKTEFALGYIKNLAKNHNLNIDILLNILQQIKNFIAQLKNKKLSCSSWTEIFAEILKTIGWPGENNLTTTELAATERFSELLHEFSMINLVTNKISYSEALDILTHMATQTIFQTKQIAETPINIMGTLEAAGINFDYLWVTGIDQENWPNAPNPNPFIPIEIQKKFNLPHSSAERELHFCKILIQRFRNSAKEVIFSYVNQNEEHKIDASLIIGDLPEISIDSLDLANFTGLAQEIYTSKKIEIITEEDVLPEIANNLIRGGSKALELQALCPFSAFAEFHLKAQEIKKSEIGINKATRGILIHNALEKFWQEIKTHENLCALNNVQLQDAIKNAVNYALDQEKLLEAIYLLEQKCLINLLTCWLEIEKNRPPFAVIETEKSINTKLGPMQIKLRIDRIDKLENGNLLLIDYKTGKKLPTIFDWFGDRPKNPQLPLYCIAVDGVSSFAFAQINIEAIKLKNISLEELKFGLNSTAENINWQDLISYWHEVLVNIAKDFITGKNSVSPLSPQICTQCKFGLICRYKAQKSP